VNCLDFRRRWLTVPNARDLALAQHERVCSSCRQFARRGSVFEPKLREALAVDVPAGLTDRIRQRRDIGEQVRARQLRPLHYALVVSLVILLLLGLLLAYQLLAPLPRGAPLERPAVTYSEGEEWLSAEGLASTTIGRQVRLWAPTQHELGARR
jgi:hypothetical protein